MGYSLKRKIILGLLLCSLPSTTLQAQEVTENEYHHRSHKLGWHYKWLGPDESLADRGYVWQKDYRGECVYLDDIVLAIRTDGFGDLRYFSHSAATNFTPSFSGLRVGSKVELRCDTRNRIRHLKVLPFHLWLTLQASKSANTY